MTRPRKNTVDYFPHSCTHGRTIFIIEQRFGNDGYAFWFKLLELLGSTEGHLLDCNNPHIWEFLVAKTRVSEVSATEMIALLVKLSAIDAELWDKRMIWCENFVNNVSIVYDKRKSETPHKPDIRTGYPPTIGVSDTGKPQRIVEDSRGEERKEKQGDPGAHKARASTAHLADGDFIQQLKANPAYHGIDVDRELGKLDAWLLTPRGRGKMKTRQRIVNWLNRCDATVKTSERNPMDIEV